MEEWNHVQIFIACFVASAGSALSAYAFSTVDSAQRFEWRKACKYPFYFGCLGTFFCMLGFDFLGGKKKWYQVVSVAGLTGLGVLKVDFLTQVARNVLVGILGPKIEKGKE
jgi:hypothetical protein